MSFLNEGLYVANPPCSEDYSHYYWEQFVNSHLTGLQHASLDMLLKPAVFLWIYVGSLM